MTFEQMVPSRFLKKEDFPKPAIMTISRFEQENVAKEDAEQDNKWVVYFTESEKGLVLGPTNLQLLKIATGVNGPDESIGHKITIFVDPTVSFGGKIVGGLRIRAVAEQAAA